jgi:hypothetical protein
MRRSVFALVLALLGMLVVAPDVGAVGPGGWDHLGVGAKATLPSLDGPVLAMNADAPGVLLVGGSFTSAGGNANASRIATWNGTAWGALAGTPISNGSVRAIAYHGGKVYAGGTFLDAGGNANADFLAVWDGSGWAPFCNSTKPGPAITATVSALQIVGNTLYVGGGFANGAGLDAADFLVGCDLTTGAASATVLHDGDINSGIYALTADANGMLYAGGLFINMAGIVGANHIAAFDGAWHALGAGTAVDSAVRSLAAWGTDVFVGTDAVNVAGIPTADHLVRWNGSAWSAVGSNTAGTDGWFPASSFIYALAVNGPMVFAAGSFQNADGAPTADQIAVFNGTTWGPIGSDGAGNGPLNAQPNAVAVFRGKVVAGGNFTAAGGDTQAVSVAAYALTQPDAQIGRIATGPFLGNNVYSPTGVGETQAVSIRRGHKATIYLSMENDGLVAAAYTVKGSGAARGITVQYFRGTTNITAAVKTGTYSSGAIAARNSVAIRMVVTVAKTSAPSGTFLVRLSSLPGTTPDAVRAVVTTR